jgi:putative nucleotidyltransferase with HDIG domain
LVILTALIIVAISPTLYFERWEHEQGTQVTRDLRSPFSITVEDRETRDSLRQAEQESVPRVYEMNVQAASDAIDKVETIFALIDERFEPGAVIERPDEPHSEVSRQLADLDLATESRLGVNLSRDVLLTLAINRRNTQFRQEIRGVFRYLLHQRGIEISDHAETLLAFLEQGRLEIDYVGGPRPFNFHEDGVLNKSEVEAGINQYLQRHSLLPRRTRGQAQALREVVSKLITGNIWPNEEETARREHEAVASIQPERYTDTYIKGEIIARAGDQLNRRQYLALRAIDDQKPYYLMMNFAGNTAMVVTLLIFLIFYLRRHRRDWAFTAANVNMVGMPLVLTLLLARVGLLVLPDNPISGYLFPAGALGMLGVILIGPRVALLLTFQGCCLFGFMTQMNFQYTMIGIVGGAAAALALFTLRRRRDILRAGFIAGVANSLAILTIKFIDNPALMVFRDWEIASHMGWGLANGLACSMITLMSLVVFEFLFRVTTDLNLIELTSIRTPLLRQLEQKTPGTYQHTLNVSKLAEAAAEAIGANYLLVRAGAHYHDIGKMVKPKYFTENQITPEERRVHAKLAPSLSALIIKEHVKKGIEMAQMHRLPDKVIDFIPQHHGTSLIKYFHTEAQRRFAMGETSDPVREEEFRYPGPRPQMVETAILMLADAVEATATAKISGASVRRDDVELLVRDAVREKFNDGQLDECDLTLADLHRIRTSLVSSLLARFHQRVDYPSATAVTRGA